jgi:hypothetical protein
MIKNISIDSSEEWKLYTPNNKDISNQLIITRNEDNSLVYISWDDSIIDLNFIDTLNSKQDL